MAFLEIKGVCKSFGGLKALDDLDLAIDEGQIVALIGPNGSGKTTLFNVISGVYKPDRGSIIFDGEHIDGLPSHIIANRGISRTFQIASPIRHMSVLENIMLGRHTRIRAQIWQILFRLPRATNEEKQTLARSAELLKKVGLEKYRNDAASILPSGMYRFLEVARAIAMDPKLLLLDEVVSGLNFEETESMHSIIRSLRDEGVTIFLVEHHMGTVMGISDKVIVLDFGHKIAEGTPTEVRNNPRVIASYLGKSG